MNKHGFIRSTTVASLMIAVAALTRLIPHAPNFTPIGAIALFAGAHLGKKARFIVPLVAMLISDMILGFHGTMPYVYGSFLLIIFIGMYLQPRPSATSIVGSALTSSILFYIITNFGVWISSDMYTKTAAGLMDAYIMGVPFFRNTVLSDLFYSLVLFYSYRYITIQSNADRISHVAT